MKNLELFPLETLDYEQVKRLADAMLGIAQIHDLNHRQRAASECYAKAMEIDPHLVRRHRLAFDAFEGLAQ